eukprot:gnl/TRDRNA2_/TRDRNA2_179971_c0_seq1.p1 gnl/TRDRNA2_/TRDRNA2_179971_c0~~gnl/TRDRNA2_/TRDRNA2_179971_c0_seq1.p1  ORF type:complete len:528 (+),score=82.97 gnl/TRDRNA2_/TRDRNA2_179971_c0_seq1:97-1680(+)
MSSPATRQGQPGQRPQEPGKMKQFFQKMEKEYEDEFKEDWKKNPKHLIRMCAAEFGGTLLLCLTVGAVINASTLGIAYKVYAGTAVGCALMVLVYILAPISGAHLNPAVTLAKFVTHKKDPHHVGLYVASQLTAGLVAGPITSGLYGNIALLQPGAGFGWAPAMAVEILYTTLLVFVVLNVTSSEPPMAGNQFSGLAIGFVLIAGAYAGGAVSGAVFNPAVALAVANPFVTVFHNAYTAGNNVAWMFAYWGWHAIGGCIGTLLATMVFRAPKQGEGEKNSVGLRCAAEAMGTFYLVLTVGLNVLSGSDATVWSASAALMCMIYALGDISGGYFNPAVTLAAMIVGKGWLSWSTTGAYIAAQTGGALLGAFFYCGIHDMRSFMLEPGEEYNWLDVLFVEFLFTMLIAYTVLSIACAGKVFQELYGFIIASSLTAAGDAIGAVSGAALNPALSIAISFTAVIDFGARPLLAGIGYVAVQFCGGLAAAGLLILLRHEGGDEEEPEKAPLPQQQKNYGTQSPMAASAYPRR